MGNQRRHKRFTLDSLEISGKMSLADRVEIIDIGLGGVALKADRRLNIGREYTIRLGDKARSIDVRGVIVRSTLSGIETGADGEGVSIYTAGMMFKEGYAAKVAEFIKSIELHKNHEGAVASDRRLTVRFRLTTPQEKILDFPSQFKVSEISLSGMRIHAERPLELGSMIPMLLALNADNAITFKGRVASCRRLDGAAPALYETGVAFTDLTDGDKKLLTAFIDYVVALEVTGKKKPD